MLIYYKPFEPGVDDVVEYVDPDGRILASVKNPFAKQRYKTELSVADKLTIAEFAAVIGFTPEAVIAAIESYRSKDKPYYSIPELATRWCMSRPGVYNILREHEAKIVDFTGDGKDRGKKVIYADIVDRIEKQRTRLIA